MRTSFLGIPDSLEESAKIDGASPMTIFTRIYLPLSKPMLMTMTLFYGVGNWNSWFNHMIYLQDRDKFPLQPIMREILIANDMSSMTNMSTVGTYTNDMYQVLVKYAVVVIATLPILCIYPFLQRYFIKGVMVGAIKGVKALRRGKRARCKAMQKMRCGVCSASHFLPCTGGRRI